MLQLRRLPGRTRRGDGPVSFSEINWSTVASLASLAGILSVLLYLLLRARLANDFVTRREHNDALERIKKTEGTIEAMPSREDMVALRTQISGVSERVAVVNANLDGVKSGVSRIEHHIDLMMQSQLDRESKS
jgi:DNA-binding FrmR family transcriptional regulator